MFRRLCSLTAALVVAWAVTIGLFGWLIAGSQRDSRAQLEQRFADRVDMAVGRLTTFKEQAVRRQQLLARRWLSARRVSEQDFEAAVAAAGRRSAVLLDERGALLQITPAAPYMLGKRIAPEYPHLRAAVAGDVAVSPVVLSAARREKLVAFAVPFDTPQGRRVFSSGYPMARFPIKALLDHFVGLAQGDFYLVDDAGQVMLTNAGAADSAIAQRSATERNGRFAGTDGDRFYAQQPVPGTPWNVLFTVPEAVLFKPTAGLGGALAWIVLVTLALAGLSGIELVRRRVAAERRLMQMAVLRHTSIQSMPGSAIFVFDRALRYTLAEGPALVHTTRPRPEQWIGRHVADVVPPEALDGVRRTYEAALRGESVSFEWTSESSGHVFENSVGPLVDPDGEIRSGLVATRDVTEHRRLEADLRRMADHDSLTGLLNRRRFEEELSSQAARCRRYVERAALLLLDLDRFKAVNDGHGHPVGDELLKHVANTLAERTRATDVLARLGGDEFAVLLSHVSPDEAAVVARDISAALRAAPLELADGTLIGATASIGMAFLDVATADAEQALVNADVAMYDAKAAGRDRISTLRGDEPGPVAQHRVLHCDDSAAYRQLLAEMLRAHGDIVLAGDAAGPRDAVSAASALLPDVILLDGSLVDEDAEVVAKLRAAAPDARILLLSGRVESSAALVSECDSTLSKSQTFDEIAAAVRGAPAVAA